MNDVFRVHIGTTGDPSGARAVRSELKGLTKEAQSFVDALKQGIGIDLGGKIVSGLQQVPGFIQAGITRGVEFNMTMADTETAIANVVQKFAKLDEVAAKNEAAKAIEKIKEVEPRAAGTLRDLTAGLMATLGSAQAAGIGIENNVELVGKFANALANANIPAEQLSQEMRAIFTGNIGPDAALGKLLEISNEDVAKAKDTGKLYDFLTDKLGKLGEAGDTFAVRASSLQSAIDKALGAASAPVTAQLDSVTRMLTEEIAKPEVVASLKEMGKGVADLIKLGGGGAKWMLQHADAMSALTTAGTAFVAVWGAGKVASILAGLGRFASGAFAPAAAVGSSLMYLNNVQQAGFAKRDSVMRGMSGNTGSLAERAMNADAGNYEDVRKAIEDQMEAAKKAYRDNYMQKFEDRGVMGDLGAMLGFGNQDRATVGNHLRVTLESLQSVMDTLEAMAPANERWKREEQAAAEAAERAARAEKKISDEKARQAAFDAAWKGASTEMRDRTNAIARLGLKDDRASKLAEEMALRNDLRGSFAFKVGAPKGIDAASASIEQLLEVASKLKERGVMPDDAAKFLEIVERIAQLTAERAAHEEEVKQSMAEQAQTDRETEKRKASIIQDMKDQLAIQEAMVRGEYELADALERQRQKRQMIGALRDSGFSSSEAKSVVDQNANRAAAVKKAEHDRDVQKAMEDAEIARLRAKGKNRQANKLDDSVYEKRRRDELGRQNYTPREIDSLLAKEMETRRRERGSRTANGSLIIGGGGRDGAMDRFRAPVGDALKPRTPGLDALRAMQKQDNAGGGDGVAKGIGQAASNAAKAATSAASLATALQSIQTALQGGVTALTGIGNDIANIKRRLTALEGSQGAI